MIHFKKKCGHFFYLLSILILIISRPASSQYYLIGTDPGSVKWRQINTPEFRVIYPVSFEGKAQYIANALEYNYVPGSRTLFRFPQKTPVILHNQTTVPSSVTYIAPRRMEFFTAPPQDIYPQDWIDQLIIHEFRHSVQYSSINCGFTKGLYYVLGEQGTFAVFGLFIPMWFIEGDATATETALHCTGRGRTPSFEMRLRTQLVVKGIYSYEKANFGSFNDFVPGKYELGYQLTGWSRVDFGTLIWSKVTNNVGRHPYSLTPFSSELKRQTGFNKYKLYDTITRQIQKKWADEDKSVCENEFQTVKNKSRKFYTNYNLPQFFRDSTIIAFKSSLDDIPGVVLLNGRGEEKKLFSAGVYYYSESLSASDSVVYWSELVTDPRWFLRDYRVIKAYNIDNGKIRQLTHQTRYYAPSVTRDGRLIAAVEVTSDNKYSLVIIDSKDGSLIKKIDSPYNFLFIHPKWSDDGKHIVAVIFGEDGNNIAIIDPESGNIEIQLPFSHMEMKRPSFYLNYILYTASYNGKDNIYAFDRKTKKVYQVTSARFGASDAAVSEDLSEIIYSYYTADGYEIARSKPDTTKWMLIDIPLKSAFPLAEELSRQENFIFNPDSVPDIKYDTRKYSKLLNLFNFHSWAPVGVDFQNISAAPGVTLLSQNLLGTTVSELGYLYNLNESTGKYYLSVSDQSLYTAIDFYADYCSRKDTGYYVEDKTIAEKWNEFNISVGLRLPLNWTHNCWIRSFQPSVSVNYKSLRMNESVPLDFTYDEIITMRYSLLASNTIKTSARDIYPRWSQLIQLDFSNTPFINSTNSVFAGQLALGLPGLGRHHVINLYGAYQKKTEDIYPFSDLIVFPRGYTDIIRKEIFSLSAVYSLPLFYPDWRIGHLFYFKRFKSSVFFDYAKSSDSQAPQSFASEGIDLRTDFGFLNIITPFDAGMRTVYISNTNKLKFEFLFAVNFGGMY